MENIVVADKQSEVATQSAWGNINLKGPGVVQMPVAPDQIATVTQRGQDLIVTLKSGEKVTIGNFFAVDQAGVGSDIVFVGEDGTLWHAQYDAAAFTGFTFEDVASLDELVAGIGTAGDAMPTWAIAGLSLLGVGGAAAAADGGGGGGSSGGADPDTTAPATPIDLLVSPDGLRLTGRGEAGSTVNIRDAAGNIIGSGTVAADGSFDVTLNPPQANGEQLEVTLTDGAGNVSAPGTVTAPDIDTPDTTAPEQPTDLALANGVTLSGRGEPGATVQVRDAAGNLIGSGVVNADGSFSLTLAPAQANGEHLDIRQVDAAGNRSIPLEFTAPDITPPDAVTNILVGPGGAALSGRGEPGATVEVRDPNGNVIGTGVVSTNGTFLINLDPAVQSGEHLSLVQTDPSGNVSPATEYDVPLTGTLDSPSNLTIDADGTTLTGTAPAGSRVEVHDANGTLIGSAIANADGSFSIELDPAQANGELLDVVAIDDGGVSSLPVQITAPDITAPAAPTELAVSADGTVLTGRAEPGSTVRIVGADGTELGTALVGATGVFSITLNPPQVDGEVVQATASDAAGNTSTASSVTAPDIDGGDTTPPDAPVDLVIGLAGSQLSGRGEAGTTVQVRDAAGNILATGTVGADGTFAVTLDPAVKDGSTLQVTLTDAAGNVSQPGSVASTDLLPPAQPTDLALANGVTFTGRGEPGATLQVRDAAGNLIGSGVVGADGLFSLTLSPAQANGEALDVRLVDAAGNTSAPLQFDAPDITPPEAVSNIVVGAGGLALSGRGEPGATVEVRDADGNVIGTGVVGANGTFLIDLDPAAQPGDLLSLVQTDPSGNASVALEYDVPLTTAPDSPSNLLIDADGTTLTGTAPAGSRVEVHDANGNLIGSAIANADGSFSIELNPAQANGELLDVVAIDDGGVSSLPAQITAPDITAPAAPTELAVSSDGTVLTGRAEPGSTVRIIGADGTELGTAVVGATGVFSITLNPPQVDGEILQATASDAAGNTSTASSVSAPDIDGGDTTPPDAPVDLVISLAGSQLSGRGEAGTTVQVRDAAGNILATGTVGADGTFAVTLDPAVKDGSTLQVTLTDAAGNVSQSGSVTSADLLPPEQPTELALADGVTFTGRGEPGATVQVRDAAGNLIGSGVVNEDGSFSLTLSPAQTNGEALDVRQVDAAGNTSAPLQFDAPDITPPDAVSNIVVGAGGLALSGRGEPGATVEVRDADGNVIGTGVVGANGTFLIDLDPAAQPGDPLSLVQTDPSGNASAAFEYDVPLTTAPDSPSNLLIDADGTTLTGTAPAGSRVEVHDANGNLIGSAIANADGSFSIELNPAQANGELLDVVAIDDGGVSSLPAQITAPDITAPAAPTELAVSSDGTVLTGRAEPGSTVRIVGADGTELGTAVVGATGVFSITLNPPQVDGEVLQATASDATGNTSTASSVTAPDIDGGDTTPPDAPVELVIGLAGSQLSGRGEAGTTVQVRDAAGNIIATGTVGVDGTFAVTLDPAVKDGSTLQVTLTDAAGNVSQPGSVASTDLLPPAQPTELALADGVTFTGRGEPGSTVQVRDAAGTLIGTGIVGADGLFTLTLSPAQANGEALDVRLVDAAGNTSTPLQFDAPDITPPDAVSNIVVGAGGLALSGRGEPGATVEVRDADGNVIGTGVVGANGTFLIDLDPAAQPGDPLSLVQTDPSGNASVAVEYDVPLTTAPDSPSNLAIDADGTTLTGTAPAGSRVEVRDTNGVLIGSALANTDGSFSIELNPPQANGELLDVVAIDDGGVSSLPAQINAPDITAPAAPSDLAVSADGSVITGRAEPGSTVRIVATDGTELGSAVVGSTGVFSIALAPPQVDGEVLQAAATDAAGNTSPTSVVTAPDIDGVDTTPPAAPTDLVIGLAGQQLSGRGEPGTTVQVRDAAGNVLATGTVAADGSFAISLDPPVNDGSTLQVTLTDAAGNVSQPGSVASPDLLPPAQPSELALAAGVTFTGRGEPGATVQVRDAAGTVIGTGVVNENGTFSLTLTPAQANGEALDVRVVDAAGNTSAPLQFDAPDITPPDAVSNIVVGAGGLALSGRGEPGATVEVRDADGNVIGTGVVGANGTFLIDLDPAAEPGDPLSLVQTDPSGNASVALEYDVPLTTAPDSPSNLLIDAAGTTLTGSAPAGSRVDVHDANGTLIGSAIANADGSFSIELNPAQANGELLDVVAIDDGGVSSLPAQITAPDITAPAAPTELAVSADGTVVTGRAEPGSTVRILAADGTELGSAVVGATGAFSIGLNPAQVDGEVLQATATDATGNTSVASSVTAPDIDGGDTTPPEAPTDLVIGLAGSQLSGRGEVGSTVQVRDAAGNIIASGTVGADGTFAVTLDPAVKDGSTLQVTLTDAAGNVSQPGSVASPDLLPPAQPSELALAEGVTFSGRGEPGATVQVRNAAGTVLGSGLVGADGLFSITLAPAQANGEALDVRLVDAAGNSSAPLQFNAPDITPPDAVSDILVGAGGTTLSGQGEAGAAVEVRDADGNLLGRGVVTANGTFVINLDPAAQPGDQLTLLQVDPSGNASVAVEYDVPLTTAPVSPSGLIIDADGTTLTGTAPAGSRVEVHDASGALIGSATANADGSFSIELNPAQANGELLNVVAIDADGVSSTPSQITAPDSTAPAAPSELAVSADGSVITGRAEPGSTVRIVAADGSELGTVVVGPTGAFSIDLSPAQIDGEVLQATATDAAGNTSPTSAVTAPDLDGVDTTPPTAPTDLVIGLAGSQLSGRGEPGANVEVRDAAGNVLATGTVGADGSFAITLDPAVNDGSALQVTLTDAAGNVSQPGSVTSPDLQPPAQPTELVLLNGVTFNGRGEPGATVQVRDAAGALIGTTIVGADGLFSLSLLPAQANGEALDVRLVDAAGNSSTPLEFTAPDITPPTAVSNIVVGGDGLVLSGRGEAGATVEVRDANDTVIGSGVVAANGTFLIDLDPAVQPGEQLSLVQTDPSGNASEALQFEVPVTTAPASPSDLVVAEDGSSISGTAPAGTRVEVRDANGALVGSVVAGADGSFTVTLDPAQANGELLDVVAIDGNGASSLPVQVTAPDITPPVAPSELVINADGSVVTGRAEAGSTVRVLAADGTTVLGSVVVGATGSFSITLDPPQVNGEVLQVTATDAAGNASTAGNVTAPDIDGGDTTPPEAPTGLLINAAGSQLSGRGEAGATVQVRDGAGNVIADGSVNPDGTFTLALSPAITDGSALQVTLTDAAGNVSQPGSVNTPDLQAPAQPTELALVDGVTFTGRGEPGATVQVRDATGTVIGTSLVNPDGSFSVTLFPAQANGEALDIRVVDAAGNSSTPLEFTAPDTTPPTLVSNIVVGADGLALSGRGEAGATVEVRDANGDVIGTRVVAANGSFLIDLDPAAQPGAQLSLVQTDPSGNASEALQYEVPITTAPASPSDLVVAEDGANITGTAPVGSRVEVHDANGTLVGTVVVGAEGTFTVILNPAQANGEKLEVVAIDGSGASSLPVQITAPDITPPVAPSELVINADGSVVTGRAEVGSTVRVLAADGTTVLGSVVVGATGSFSITLDPPQVDGEVLQVTATDAAGNASTAGNVTAPDIDGGDTTPPDAASNLVVGLAGAQLSGRGEAGANVQVRDAQGNVLANGTVNPDGTFQVTLDPAIKDGSTLQVVLTDAAGNASEPASVVTPDLQAPTQPTGLDLADGVTLTGGGEPGATVQVRDAAGNVIGTGVVDVEGSFSVTLSPAQDNGEVLDIRLVDTAGNVSTPLQFDAPDITPPAVVSNIVVGADGLSLSGRGEAGATVEVRDASGTLIGSGTVTENGTFLLDLDPAALPGERVSLVQTDPSGNASEALTYDVPLVVTPTSPSGLVVAEDGASISGSAPAGSRVEVHDANGTLVGSIVVGAEGTFTVVLDPAQANGELLDVVAVDSNGLSSLPVQVTAPDITPPVAPSELTIAADGTVVSGRAEAGSTVHVLAADGTTVLGEVVVGASGAFEITLTPPQVAGEQLQVTATDEAGNASQAGTITAPIVDNGGDTTPPEPASELVISNDGRTVSGRGEVGATVEVRNDQGEVLVSGTVQPDGSFNVTLPTPVVDGSSLQVTLTDAAGNVSTPSPLTAPDHVAPVQPSDLALANGVTLSGNAEAGARVDVRDASGNLIGSTIAGQDGTFSLTLDPAQANGETVSVRVTDAAGNTSVPLSYVTPDITPPQIISNVVAGAGSLVISGRGEAGATVEVRDANGVVIGTAIVAANGTFLVDLNGPIAAGDAIVLQQTDAAGNPSVSLTVIVPPTAVPESPAGLVVAADGSSISGTAPVGSLVEVRDTQGTPIGSVQVGNDGTFTLPLTPAQANGELLDVVAIDADGNSSLPSQINAPDITPPNEASELQLSNDGSVLTGRGEPGTTVQVVDAQGNVLGNAQVGADGVISVVLTPPQTDGQELDVVLRDAAGNSSTANVIAPDLDGPLQPSGLAVDTTGIHLTGQGQSGSTVTVRDADGNVLGTATVGGDGRFDVTLNAPQRNGESLTVEATDSQGNSAGPVDFTAPDHTPPQVVTTPAIDDNGTTVTGNGEPGATVTVRGPDGSVLGSIVVGAGGAFEITLDTPQTNGQALTVEQRDPSGNLSAAVDLPAPDNEAPETPAGLTLAGDGGSLSGSGEPGAQVTVTGTGGAVLGTATVQPDGIFLVTIDPPQLNGQTLSVTQADSTGNISIAGSVTAPDLEAPVPAQGLGINDTGTALTGQAEPGSTVEVRNGAGDLLGSAVVEEDGSFSVPLVPAQTNGETVSVVVVDGGGNTSPSTAFTADDTTAPGAPAGLTITSGGNAIQGTGEAGSTVEVRNAGGDLLGSVVVPAGGNFTVPIAPAQLDGQALQVTLTDAAGNVSGNTPITAPDITPPALPTGVEFSEDGNTVVGNAPGAASVIVRNAAGVETTATVNPDGSFSVTLPSTLNNGETVTVIVSDPAGNSSAPVTVTAPDNTEPEPATGVTVSPDGSTVGGTAEPGSTVVIRDPVTGGDRGTTTAGPDGTFVVDVDPPLTTGENATVVVIDPAGNESGGVTVTGPTGTEAATPAGLAISADGFVLTGTGTAGSLITVTSGGTTLGTATVGSDGTFRVFFGNAQLNAQTLQVSARIGADGQPSVPATVVANDTTAPNAPTADINRTGNTLTGQGEVGATVRVTDAQGTLLGTAVVGSNGLYSVTLTPAAANGQNLIITQADAAGNTSLAASVQAPDLQAPLAASNLSLNSAATVLSGQGEAGASVTVRDASGAILATGTVNQSGQFQITLPSAQTSGAALQVTLSDAAGNVSGPASLATPDRTPPAAVSNPVLSQDGRQLSGSGEVGATVQVRNGSGAVLGTATVGADGRFSVTFDTPQVSGQAIGVTQVDAAGNTSPAVNVTTSDLTPPAPLTNVVLNNNGLTLTGLGEAGASVTVRGPDGTIIGTGLVAANGSFSLTLTTAQLNAQQLGVTQTDAGNNTSASVAVTAPDFTPPAAPTALALSGTGLQLTGNAEAGSTVTVRDASGNVLGTVVASSNGTFQVTLNSAQTNGQTLQVTATDAAGNVSQAAPYTAADTTPPAAVSNLAVSADGATLTGQGEAAATVTVRAPDGTVLGTTTVAADGSFSVTLSPAAFTGENLSVVQADAAQNASPAQTVTAPGVLAPATPDNLVLAADGLSVTGTATAGSTVNVYGPNGVLLGSSPVANDGTFTVDLGSAQANGEVLHVSATGSDGTVSLPATLLAPDTTAPQPLTNLVLSNDGLVLTGRGEPGATVTVIGEGGIDLGTALVDANGNFSANLSAAQINGELLSASQADATGNESNSISLTAPDRVAPDAAENLAFAGGGSLLNGSGEAGANVWVMAADGSALGSGVVRADGTFQVNLNAPQANGQHVQVILTDAAGNQSAASAITAPDTTPPVAPSELAVSGDGVTLTGRGEVGALVTVTDLNGAEIGSATVDASGNFTITLNPALGNAELLSFTQTDAAGNVSAVATLLTPDFTPPAPLTQVLINADGSVVSGLGEAGATVIVSNAAGTVLGTGTVLADGSFRVELSPAQINNQVLSVLQADPPGNVSEPVTVQAPDHTPPAAATELRLNAAGDELGGLGEAGATARVYVGTTQIGTAVVAANGTFVVELDAAQLNGQVVQVTLTDAAGNISPISSVTAVDITPPATVVATINDSGTQVVGSAEAGTRVTVINNNGDLLGQVTVDPDGTFVLGLNQPQINGETLTIIAQDPTGNPSLPLEVTAPDLTAPVQPGNLLLNPAGTSMTGTAEAGTLITVRGPDGTVVGSVQVGESGQFTAPINPAQNNGQLLTVVSTDAAGNASLPAEYQTLDSLRPDPVTELVLNNTYTVLTGRGEAGATVTVTTANGTIGTAVVSEAGTFSVNLTGTVNPLTLLTITQADPTGNVSDGVSIFPPLINAPPPPTNVVLAADGLILSGTANSGVGIRVYDAAGNQIGSGSANLNGGFTLQLNVAQLNGEQITVVANTLLGGDSQPVFVLAADVTPPANPAVTSLSANGLVLVGTGEAGATVTVRDVGNNVLGTAVVNAAGGYSVNLSAAQLNGQVLAVSQTDRAGNLSGSTSYTAIDVQPPAAPTNVTINGAGTVLTGTGEAGATVTVLGPNGQVGSGVVQANGTFSITLTTAQNDGQLLVVRQADAAGNLSASTSLTAPDTTPPAAPLATINPNGTSVSGSGQVGSTVTVRNSAGTVLGTATVGSNGLFVVSLTAAQIDNQALSVTLTDSAGNVSTGTALTAPDLTPPAAAGNLVFSADGGTLTGTGEVGATVTVRSASGTVLQTATVQPNGTFTVTLSPPQDNGQILSVTLADPRGNVSGNVNVTAPDVDANAPVIASDNLATATVNLAAVTASKTYTDSFTTLLAGFTKTYTWTVAAGTTADPTLTLTTSSALALLDNTTFTLQVKNASGNWVTLATGNSQGLLDLILLPLGQGLRVDIGVLQAGDYRLTVGSGGIGLITTVGTTLDITSTSLTEFIGTGTATSGNVITDVGTDGAVDARGPDSAAVLQVLKGGSYVSAGSATTVQGLYGTLVIRGDGSYTYTPNGSPASVGKVDVFSYQLVHPNGLSDSANLYVRIDSPQATEIWSNTNYGAPATVLDAVNDVGFSQLTLANRVDTSSSTLGSLSLPVIGTRQATYTTTVAADTTSNLQVVVNSANLLSLLNGTTIDLLKLNPATGQYVLVQSVGGGSLVSLLGGGAGYTFQNQGAGTYHVRVTAGGIGLLSSITTSLNATTTHLTEFVVSGATAATGNLLTDDNVGSALTVLSVLTAANTYTIPGYNGVSVAGTYGTLLVHADGSYTYTLNSGLTSAAVGQHDTFTYELTHPNGTTDTATLTINLDNAAGLTTTTSLLADTGEEAVALASLAVATDVLAGTDGNDHLVGSQGGHITLEGGAGDDTLVVVDQNFASVDGGTGTDTLQWGGGDASIDLGNLVGRVHDIEIIDLNDTSSVALTLNLADVVAITETGNNTLMIKGDENDSVHMTDNWSLVGNQTADGIDYNQYTAQEDPSHQLWVQNGIHVV
ncbi:BapA/Bap/LapF family large adhesin [Pseudomonas sp. NPDC089408]|uniref:BapA/Bap/LapF family large adhesin n=1 Tax=Pseudomonas sp. NPDC089408 TaxID=3364465 RepID=UPI00381F7A95